MEKIQELETKVFKQLQKVRNEIKINRKEFWAKNRTNFKNNIKNLVSFFKFPEKWRVNVSASTFLLDKQVLPYDKDVWSFSDVVSATEEQGFEMVIFFNKIDLEFLSMPALLPIVVHECAHVFQAAKDTRTYINATLSDEQSRIFEKEADSESSKYNDEFRRENILEKILFCYDLEGWTGAKKIADYLFKDA